MKIIDNLRDGYEILKENKISSFKIDCEILMSQTLSISREKVLLNLEKNIKQKEKERYFGIWINNQYVTYSNIPSLFFLSSSKEINEILPESILINEDLSFEKILNNKTFNQNFIFKNDQENWNENFVRIKKEQSFYKSFEMKKVKDKLFQTSVFFPTNTIPGIYNVDIYYIRNNTIMSTDQKNIVIKKTGIGSQIFDFANENAATYGVFVIIFSIFSGFVAAALFRRSK